MEFTEKMQKVMECAVRLAQEETTDILCRSMWSME